MMKCALCCFLKTDLFPIELWCDCGLYTTTADSHHSSFTIMKCQSTSQSESFIKRRLWSLLGGLQVVSSTKHSWGWDCYCRELLLKNWQNVKSSQLWSLEKDKSCFLIITRPRVSQRTLKKLNKLSHELSLIITFSSIWANSWRRNLSVIRQKQSVPSTNLLAPRPQISARVEYWNLFLVGKGVSIVMVFILISEGHYELTCNLLKYKIENQKLFHNNKVKRTVKVCTVRWYSIHI